MKKVAIFLPSLRGGGAEYVMMTLANRFAALGHSVDLVLVQAVGPNLSQVSSDIRIVDLGASRTLFAVPQLVKYLKQEQPQAMLSAMAHANVVAVLARQLSGSGTRLVISERNHASIDLAAMTPFWGVLTKFAMRWAYPKADSVTAVSSGVAEDLATVTKIARHEITTIYNPIVSDKLIEKSKEDADHEWLSPTNKLPVILAVGRLSKQKDFQTLIRSMKLVRENVDARLIILGEGELREELERMVTDLGLKQHISMPGFIENPFSYMHKCSVFVLSSKWEGLPGVLIQAMACGAPVVSTDCPSGPAEILEGGKWGRLTPVGNEKAMAEAIQLSLKDSLPQSLVANRVQQFNVAVGAKKYLEELDL